MTRGVRRAAEMVGEEALGRLADLKLLPGGVLSQPVPAAQSRNAAGENWSGRPCLSIARTVTTRSGRSTGSPFRNMPSKIVKIVPAATGSAMIGE